MEDILVIVGILFFIPTIVCSGFADSNLRMIKREVNSLLPKEKHFGMLVGGRGQLKLWKLHRQNYPKSEIRRSYYIYTALGVFFFLGSILAWMKALGKF